MKKITLKLQNYVSLVTLIFTISSQVDAGVIRNTSSTPELRYTTLANQPRFDAVGALLSQTEKIFFGEPLGGPSDPSSCSGTLISSSAFLTAAHCITSLDKDGKTQIDNLKEMAVGFGGNFNRYFTPAPAPETTSTAPRLIFSVLDAFVAPGFDRGSSELIDKSYGPDLAILRIGDPLTHFPVPPSIAPSKLYTGDIKLAQDPPIITITGYGMGGLEDSPIYTEPGIKRAGLNLIDSFSSDRGRDSLHYSFGEYSYKGVPLPSNFLEYLAAPGDSGGGNFMVFDGVTELVAVTRATPVIPGVAVTTDTTDKKFEADSTVISGSIPWINHTLSVIDGQPITSAPGGDFTNPLHPNTLVATDYPIGTEGFTFPINPGELIFIDPPIADGFEYEVEGSQKFTGIQLPIGIGDNLYSVDVFDESIGGFKELPLTIEGGVLYVLAEPTGRFQVHGIEETPGSFVTGLMFASSGITEVFQIPLTSVPEPSIYALFLVGIAFLGIRARWYGTFMTTSQKLG